MEINHKDNGVDVLSLFDGMACGMIAFKNAGIRVNHYYTYEIDPYAVKTAKHNFPEIIGGGGRLWRRLYAV